RSAMHTLRPVAANRFAAASPMPLAPPVTTATRPDARAGWRNARFCCDSDMMCRLRKGHLNRRPASCFGGYKGPMLQGPGGGRPGDIAPLSCYGLTSDTLV